MGLLTKYLTGWLTEANVLDTDVWEREIAKARNEECELVIFKIPNSSDPVKGKNAAISAIEKLLQEQFGG